MSATQPEQLCETDFYAWTQAQAKALRRFAKTRPNVPLDLAHIAKEIQDLGMSERSAVFSLVRLIIQHFVLVAYSPAPEQRRHWLDEVDEFRSQIEDKLTPTIGRDLEAELGGRVQPRTAQRSAQDAPLRRGSGCRRASRSMPLRA